MSATSVTGTGPGQSNSMTLRELNEAVRSIQRMLGKMSIIVFAESKAAVDAGGGPEAEFTFDPTPEDADAYVFLTNAEGGGAEIVDIQDNDDGKLIGVTVSCNTEDTVWLAVIRKGVFLES